MTIQSIIQYLKLISIVYLFYLYRVFINIYNIIFLITSINYQMMSFLDTNQKQFIKISEEQFIKKYKHVAYLGKGAYGEVTKAQTEQKTFVALKKFKPDAIHQFRTILRQINNLKRMNHPNILKFYNCYVVDGNRYYLVTEYCSGGSLSTYLLDHQINQGDRLKICYNIAQGLAYAHEEKVVHRDLKPENIVINQKGIAKIADFGCSTKLANNQVLSSRIGSPAYMDDRILNNQTYDIKVDIYSLGMVFLYIYKGSGIYDDCKTNNELKRMKSEIYRDYEQNIQNYIIDLPFPIKEIVKNCLSNNHLERYPADKIASMIKVRLTQTKNLSNSLMSTQDDLSAELQNPKTLFACNLIAMNKQFQFRHRCQRTRHRVLNLLYDYQRNYEKISNIQSLKYVDANTKAQFTFIFTLYYKFWLTNMKHLINQQQTTFNQKYRDIDVQTLSSDTREISNAHIQSQQQKNRRILYKCAQNLYRTIHFQNQGNYLPDRFKQFVTVVVQRQTPNFLKSTDAHLKLDIKEYIEKRIKKQYQYNRSNGPHDDKLSIICSLADGFN